MTTRFFAAWTRTTVSAKTAPIVATGLINGRHPVAESHRLVAIATGSVRPAPGSGRRMTTAGSGRRAAGSGRRAGVVAAAMTSGTATAAAESCHPFSLNAPSDSAAALATTLMTPARV